jgi:nitronate monooxygenase
MCNREDRAAMETMDEEAWTTPFTQRFAVRLPIVSAPMGGAAGGRLAAAVSNAGGLGLIGPGYSDREWIARELDAAAGARVGIGFISWHLAHDPGRLTFALERGVRDVMLSFGDASPFVEPVRRAGARLILQVQSLAAAREAVALGPDAIVAQGTEAGGHGADRALFPLLPAVVDVAGSIPVLGAGGVSDGRGLVAALALGASGALVGTRLFVSEESLGHDGAKARLVASSGDATVRTTTFDVVRGFDWPRPFTGRALRNAFTDEWHDRAGELADSEDERERYRRAAAVDDFDVALIWAGQGVDAVTSIRPAGAIVAAMAREARAALDALSVHRLGAEARRR